MEKEDAPPEPNIFGGMPSQGFYPRHVKDIELSNAEIEALKPELRPLMVLEDVEGVDLFRIKAAHPADVPAQVMNHARNIRVSLARRYTTA